jgi:hypothetical protein
MLDKSPISVLAEAFTWSEVGPEDGSIWDRVFNELYEMYEKRIENVLYTGSKT